MATKKITDLVKLTDLDATDSLVVNDSSAGADKRVEFSDLQAEVLNGASIGGTTPITQLTVDNLRLDGNTISSQDTNGNILFQPNGTGDVVINDSGADVDFRVEGDTEQNLLFVDASTDRVGIGTSSPATLLEISDSASGTVSTSLNLRNSAEAVDSSSNIYFSTGSGLTAGNITSIIRSVVTQASPSILKSDLAIFTNSGDSVGERMRIDSSGNVGIGVSPSYKLDVSGVVNANGILIGTNGDSVNKSGANFFIQTTSDHDLIFRRNSGEKIRVTTNGLTFNGDTAAANALDDYEETTFTPVIIGTTTAGTGTYTTQFGRCTKIGRIVQFSVSVEWNAHTGTGNIRVGNLPFIGINGGSSSFTQPCSIASSAFTFSNQLSAFIGNNTNQISPVSVSSGGGVSSIAIDTSGSLWISGVYETV